MSDEQKEPDLSMWFSTYGLVTAERILETFQMKLTHDEIITAISNSRSMYHHLLRIPLKNIFNGIILQQAHDYQVYAQKLFVDYLLSGQNDKEAESQGANTRDDLENERTQLVALGEAFNAQEIEHQKLIAESQARLIELSRELQKSLQAAAKKTAEILRASHIDKTDALIIQAIRTGMIHDDHIEDITSLFWVKMADVLATDLNNETLAKLAEILGQLVEFKHKIDNILGVYLEKTEDMGIELRGYRAQFYQSILRTTEFLNVLPDYHPDPLRGAENLSTLDFDARIGEV